MLIATPLHLGYEPLVPLEEGTGLTDPTSCLWVPRVTTSAAVHHQDVPEPVQFSVLPEEMLPAELAWRYIPDSHLPTLSRRAAGPIFTYC